SLRIGCPRETEGMETGGIVKPGNTFQFSVRPAFEDPNVPIIAAESVPFPIGTEALEGQLSTRPSGFDLPFPHPCKLGGPGNETRQRCVRRGHINPLRSYDFPVIAVAGE